MCVGILTLILLIDHHVGGSSIIQQRSREEKGAWEPRSYGENSENVRRVKRDDSATTPAPRAWVPPSEWHLEDYPNPQYDPTRCGRNGFKSYICDPNGVISYNQGEILPESLLMVG